MLSEPISPPIDVANLDQTEDQDKSHYERFLKFKLFPDTDVLLSLAQMVEITIIPVFQIVPIPQLPHWVMGIYNWQGQIIWLIDLGQLVGLPPIYEKATANYATIIVRRGAQELGLLVHRVDDIELINPDLIQSPPETITNLEIVPFLRGFLFGANDDLMVVMDSNSIFDAMPKESDIKKID